MPLKFKSYIAGLKKAIQFIEAHPELKGPAEAALEEIRAITTLTNFEANIGRLKALDSAALVEQRLLVDIASGNSVLAETPLLESHYIDAQLAETKEAAWQLQGEFTQRIAGLLGSQGRGMKPGFKFNFDRMMKGGSFHLQGR